MSKTVVSNFGTFTDKEIDILKKGIKEMSDVFTMQESQKEILKDIINNMYEELKIPKRMIRKMAKTYHDRNYSEVVAENEEFSLLYEGVIEEFKN